MWADLSGAAVGDGTRRTRAAGQRRTAFRREAKAGGEDRDEMIEIVRSEAPFAGLPGQFRSRVAHDDAVVGLVSSLVRLARSAIGEYEAIRHRDRPVDGLRFHSEASGASGLTILGNFVGLRQQQTTTKRPGSGRFFEFSITAARPVRAPA